MLDYMCAYYNPKNILVSVSGSFSVSAGVDVAKAHRAIAIILKEIVKVNEKAVKENELRRAKDYFLSQLSMALEDTLEHLLWVGERVMDRGELPDKKEINENIESVTVRDFQEMAAELFHNKNLTLVLIWPLTDKDQKKITKDFEMR